MRPASLLAVLCAILPQAGASQERILSFDSEIEIIADGGMNVVETIRVYAQGDRIQRGIFRDFPTNYRDTNGNRYRVLFEVVEVSRDGAPEPYFTERVGDGLRLYIGSPDTYLAPGEYEYRLLYRTNRQLGFFESHDELYWNVTGNGWSFAIESASAHVSLPSGARIRTIEGYVGPAGSRDQSYEEAIDANGNAVIATTRRLSPGEGLTLVATWAKGVIREPTAMERTQNLLLDNPALLIALIGLIAAFSWLMLAWARAGKDPDPGVIFPHYGPPQGFSPASVRYVSRMGYDSRAFTAATLNLAVKGYLEIEETDGEFTLRRTGRGKAPLSPGEKGLVRALFRDGDSLKLENDNHEVICGAMLVHRAALNRDFNKIYFRTNATLLIPASLIVALSFGLAIVMGPLTPASVLVLAGTLLLSVAFYFLMKAPTTLGRRMLDKIEGFRLYLEVAEKDALALTNPPDKTPQLFEAYLPYAMALGVEHAWAEKFVDVFARLSTSEGAYHPAWYHGTSDALNLAAQTGGGLNSAVAASAMAPGSSSGAGGGGFSGGGGGGGGGGGW
jgi:uncharacterized membrane protein YgcG